MTTTSHRPTRSSPRRGVDLHGVRALHLRRQRGGRQGRRGLCRLRELAALRRHGVLPQLRARRGRRDRGRRLERAAARALRADQEHGALLGRRALPRLVRRPLVLRSPPAPCTHGVTQWAASVTMCDCQVRRRGRRGPERAVAPPLDALGQHGDVVRRAQPRDVRARRRRDVRHRRRPEPLRRAERLQRAATMSDDGGADENRTRDEKDGGGCAQVAGGRACAIFF